MSFSTTQDAQSTSSGRKISQDPLVHHGHHLGRAFHAMSDDAPEDEILPAVECKECAEEVIAMADLIQKGANGTRADDTKEMKGLIIDWITPKGQSLIPHIHCNVKSGCGFNHVCTGALLCPVGLDWNNLKTCTKLTNGKIQVARDQWPVFLNVNYMYDPEYPWNSLPCSGLLILVFKHIFMLPSTVDQEPKATCLGNAHIHSMHSTMKVSLAYVATQACFALTSAQVFSCTNLTTDSKHFYNSTLELLDNPDEKDICQVFPLYSDIEWFLSKNSALSRICAKWVEYNERNAVIIDASN
ncbi:hypothetical protein V8B97DRAFT_2022616 [Scleroderma yunnanense]